MTIRFERLANINAELLAMGNKITNLVDEINRLMGEEIAEEMVLARGTVPRLTLKLEGE